jgi:hypothetical protein
MTHKAARPLRGLGDVRRLVDKDLVVKLLQQPDDATLIVVGSDDALSHALFVEGNGS